MMNQIMKMKITNSKGVKERTLNPSHYLVSAKEKMKLKLNVVTAKDQLLTSNGIAKRFTQLKPAAVPPWSISSV